MIWGLLIVLGILLIIYGLARKKLTFIQGGGKGAIKLLETRHLMPKKTLFLVEVEGTRYLLGGGADTLALITRVEPVEPKPSFDQILENSEREPMA
jgi:flagellar protein FliO/FliZ